MAAIDTPALYRARLEETALRPIFSPGRGWYVSVGVLSVILLAGLVAYGFQIRDGLIVTGMRDRISWGLYIASFVFFIGISYAGALVSAILRTSQAGWRTPVTRMAEISTVSALFVGGLMPMLDLGRPDRIPFLFTYGRWQSPILWDVIAVFTYFVASVSYLYLPLIPDLALARDRLQERGSRWAVWFYRSAALGWRNTPRQQALLRRAMTVMMVAIVPIAVSAHTVLSWIFATTLREPWDSALFGIFFVAGAIFSGIAVLLLLMATLRRVYHLEEYLQLKHFVYLGYLLAAFAAVMFYFNVNEYLVNGYKPNPAVDFNFNQLFRGQFAGLFWFYLLGGLVVPVLIIAIPRTRTINGVLVASALVVVGMFVERYFIVIASLRVPLLAYEPRNYIPSVVEVLVLAGAFALFGLIILMFLRIVPLISIWEQAEEHELERLPEAAPEAVTGALAPDSTGGGS